MKRIIATNETAYNISVIHNQITDKEAVISVLSSELSIDEKTIRSKVDTSVKAYKPGSSPPSSPSRLPTSFFPFRSNGNDLDFHDQFHLFY